MNATHESIGMRMQQRRTQLGLTLQQVADAAQLTKSTISRYEHDEFATPREVVVTAIAQALRVSSAWLLCKTDDPSLLHRATPPVSAGAESFTYALFEEAGELTPENQEKLLEMARFFKQQQEKSKGI